MKNKVFRALIDEGQFTRQVLGVGVTLLSKANYAEKGYYFTSFTAISTGLERIGKLCFLLDYYIENNASFPSEKVLKHEIRHDIEKLYTKSVYLVNKYNITSDFIKSVENEICQKIINILSKFAKGDRYSNIDLLVGSMRNESDPIKDWNKYVDENIYTKRVSNRKKEKIKRNAEIIGRFLDPISSIYHFSEARKEIDNVREASYLTGKYEAVSKYRQLYVLQIIRYWVIILKELQYEAMKLNQGEIPFFNEIFSIFSNEDSYFLTRKTYDSLR